MGTKGSNTWRPERRNRKIGTKASGYAKSNKMRIPEGWLDRHGNVSVYYERMIPEFDQEVEIGDCTIRILYEPPREGYSYGCSPNDVVRLLNLVVDTTEELPDLIAFRQPTQKQRQQFPVWGRYIYYAEIGRYHGDTVVLEAQKLGAPLKRPKQMTLEDRAEFERLKQDGHVFSEKKRHFEASLEEANVRNTLLYRTLLHEVGHMVDYCENVLDCDDDDACDIYFARPTSELEVFAHSFADKLGQSLRERGEIPFAPLSFEAPSGETNP